jgi:2-dehydropantoate 2-reductase
MIQPVIIGACSISIIAHTGRKVSLEKLNILSFGAGAIGTYIGGALALAGNRVVFVEQADSVKELRERGLRLDLTIGRNSVFEIRDSSVAFRASLEEALGFGPFDFAIYALKSFDTESALEAMKPYALQLPPVLCLSNGVDNEPAIAVALGSDKVIAGTVTSSIGRYAVGDIVLERLRGIGLADRHPLSLLIAGALNAAGLNAHLFLHPADMKWSKMLTNLPANATAAILDMTAAEVFAHPGLFRLEMRMLREALAVMQASHLRVLNLPRVPVKALALGTRLPELIARPLMLKAVGGGRGGKMPSFHIDLHSGRGKSEVSWLNGAVVRHGEKVGVPTPVNQLLTETLLGLTRSQIPLAGFSHQPEKLLSLIGRS